MRLIMEFLVFEPDRSSLGEKRSSIPFCSRRSSLVSNLLLMRYPPSIARQRPCIPRRRRNTRRRRGGNRRSIASGHSAGEAGDVSAGSRKRDIFPAGRLWCQWGTPAVRWAVLCRHGSRKTQSCILTLYLASGTTFCRVLKP
jgi:hypothetical protein